MYYKGMILDHTFSTHSLCHVYCIVCKLEVDVKNGMNCARYKLWLGLWPMLASLAEFSSVSFRGKPDLIVINPVSFLPFWLVVGKKKKLRGWVEDPEVGLTSRKRGHWPWWGSHSGSCKLGKWIQSTAVELEEKRLGKKEEKNSGKRVVVLGLLLE